MENYIVKLKSYYKDECIRFGTGIVIGDREILTASHVVNGERYTYVFEDQEIELTKTKDNSVAAILCAENKLPYSAAKIFSQNEILNDDAQWIITGYITSEQCDHHMTGTGIVFNETHGDCWNYNLSSIKSGNSGDYSGLSGAPVVSCSRIVGILQEQTPMATGALGVRMASVEMFKELLREDNTQLNEYETLIYQESQRYSRDQVDKNKKSRKYIPDIFVEEGTTKESLRFFSDPCLFLSKAIQECKCIDFSRVNDCLENFLGLKSIDFSDFSEEILPGEEENIVSHLENRLIETLDKLKSVVDYGNKKEFSWEKHYHFNSITNNSTRFILEDILKLIRFSSLNYVLLTKQAGQGKTNFLCDFTENFLLKKGFCVWYFNAYELREKPMNIIWDKICMRGKYSREYVAKVLEAASKRTGRPVMIVIDGLNENTAVPAFGDVICEFLEECSAFPFVKVIMSTRKELLKERFGALVEGRQIAKFQHIEMYEISERFRERIFWGYLNYFDIEIRKETLSQETYKKLTEDVLLLRFFCEVNEHGRQLYMYDIYKYAVFEQYLVKKVEEYKKDPTVVDAGVLIEALINHICKYMIEKKSYFSVPLEEFSQDQKLLQKMIDNEVIFKAEELVEEGFWEGNKVVISFTFDEFRDFCITNYILKNYGQKEAFEEIWNEIQKNNPTIKEGIQKYVFYLSKTKYSAKLLPVVQGLDEYPILYWEYIWDIEDQYITGDDLNLWKNQIKDNGEYAPEVLRHLFGRCDCEYFSKANIKLMFEALDEIMQDSGKFYKLINAAFGKRTKDYFGRYNDSRIVCPANKMFKDLFNRAKNDKWNRKRGEYFRLVIYLYELDAEQAQAVWDRFYEFSPDKALEILHQMNEHPRCLIAGNVKSILRGLLKNNREGEANAELECLDRTNAFGKDLKETACSISEIFAE